jgi:phage gp36-like protein
VSYAVVQDLVDAFGEDEMVRVTTPDGGELGAVNAPKAQRCLDEASDLMDSYLRRRYQVPVTSPSTVLRRCCCVLARKMLREGGHTEPSDQVVAAYNGQLKWLEQIVEGRVTLDGAVLAGPVTGTGARTNAQPRPQYGQFSTDAYRLRPWG